MRSTDSPNVQWVSVGEYRACFERYADGARFEVRGKRETSAGYPRPRIIARGVVGGAGVAYASTSPPLNDALERELVRVWHSLSQGGAEQ